MHLSIHWCSWVYETWFGRFPFIHSWWSLGPFSCRISILLKNVIFPAALLAVATVFHLLFLTFWSGLQSFVSIQLPFRFNRHDISLLFGLFRHFFSWRLTTWTWDSLIPCVDPVVNHVLCCISIHACLILCSIHQVFVDLFISSQRHRSMHLVLVDHSAFVSPDYCQRTAWIRWFLESWSTGSNFTNLTSFS